MDLITYREELRSAVPNEEKCIIINDHSNFIFAYQIQKRGYVFRDNYLPAGWIKNLSQDHGIKYLYSDSRTVDDNEEVRQLIDSTILTAGSIKIFRLK